MQAAATQRFILMHRDFHPVFDGAPTSEQVQQAQGLEEASASAPRATSASNSSSGSQSGSSGGNDNSSPAALVAALRPFSANVPFYRALVGALRTGTTGSGSNSAPSVTPPARGARPARRRTQQLAILRTYFARPPLPGSTPAAEAHAATALSLRATTSLAATWAYGLALWTSLGGNVHADQILRHSRSAGAGVAPPPDGAAHTAGGTAVVARAPGALANFTADALLAVSRRQQWRQVQYFDSDIELGGCNEASLFADSYAAFDTGEAAPGAGRSTGPGSCSSGDLVPTAALLPPLWEDTMGMQTGGSQALAPAECTFQLTPRQLEATWLRLTEMLCHLGGVCTACTGPAGSSNLLPGVTSDDEGSSNRGHADAIEEALDEFAVHLVHLAYAPADSGTAADVVWEPLTHLRRAADSVTTTLVAAAAAALRHTAKFDGLAVVYILSGAGSGSSSGSGDGSAGFLGDISAASPARQPPQALQPSTVVAQAAQSSGVAGSGSVAGAWTISERLAASLVEIAGHCMPSRCHAALVAHSLATLQRGCYGASSDDSGQEGGTSGGPRLICVTPHATFLARQAIALAMLLVATTGERLVETATSVPAVPLPCAGSAASANPATSSSETPTPPPPVLYLNATTGDVVMSPAGTPPTAGAAEAFLLRVRARAGCLCADLARTDVEGLLSELARYLTQMPTRGASTSTAGDAPLGESSAGTSAGSTSNALVEKDTGGGGGAAWAAAASLASLRADTAALRMHFCGLVAAFMQLCFPPPTSTLGRLNHTVTRLSRQTGFAPAPGLGTPSMDELGNEEKDGPSRYVGVLLW